MKKMKGKDGGVLVMVMVVMLAFSVLAIGLFKLHDTDTLETVYVKQATEAFWVAEAGLQSTLTKLRRSNQDGTDYRDGISTDENSPTIESDTVGNGSYRVELWGDGSTSNFWVKSRGTVKGQERLLGLSLVLNAMGPYGLTTLNGDSEVRSGGVINGSIYQNGKLTTRGDVAISGEVLADNAEDFSNGKSIPEDGYIDMHIETDYFAPYLALGTTVASSSIGGALDLMDGTVVVGSSIDPTNLVSTGSSPTSKGVLVIKGNQTFSKDLVIGSHTTIIVDGDLKISKDAWLGDNVTLFATGTVDLFKDAKNPVVTGLGSSILSVGNIKVWKDFTFDGMIFTEGTFYADKDLTVTGTIINEKGFTLKKDATVTFNEGVIPPDTFDNMISLSFIVNQSTWVELPAN